MTSPLRTTLEAFRNQRILVLGDVLLDEYLAGDCSQLSPEAPVPVVTVGSSKTVLGGAANTAHNITALGGQAVLIGLSAADDAGRQLLALAARAGIDFVPIVDHHPTVRKIRVLGQQQQLLRLDYESPRRIDPEAERRTLHVLGANLASCAAVVVSDYAKGFLTASLCRSTLAAAHAAGKPVIIDPRPQHADFYAGCDFLTPNWKESRGLLGLSEERPTAEEIEKTGRLLVERFGAHVLMTLGPKGMAFFDRSTHEHFGEPSIAREVFDVSGAGDTVVAAFSLAIAAGWSHRDAVSVANRAAGLVVGKLGTATITPEELIDLDETERVPVAREDLAGLASRLRAQGVHRDR